MALADSQPAGVAITNAFGYNVRSEVTSALMGTNAYGYVFDPIGNRIVSTNNAEVSTYTANGLNHCRACLTVPNDSDYVERIDEILENWRLPSVDVIGKSCFTKPK